MRGIRVYTAGAAITFAVAAVLLLLACSSDTTGPAAKALGEGRVDGDIYGYCTDASTGQPLGAHVVWRCVDDNSLLGELDADASTGRYDIFGEGWWTNHRGHHFRGTATKTGYYPATADINPYDPDYKYRRDFALTPQ